MLKITIWPRKSKEALEGDQQRHGHRSLVHFLLVKTCFFWNTFGFSPLVKRNKRLEYLCRVSDSYSVLGSVLTCFLSLLFSVMLFLQSYNYHTSHIKRNFSTKTPRGDTAPHSFLTNIIIFCS